MTEAVAAFGIGSSRFRFVAGTPDGEFLTPLAVEPTEPRGLPAQVARAVGTLRDRLDGELTAVSVACAGLVDADAGVIRELDTPEGDVVRDIRLAEAVEYPLHLINDCAAAAIGEWAFGAGADRDCLAHVTIGTGIGAGVIDRGRLLTGANGHAAEVGLFPVGPPDRESLGIPGAWEAVCSGRGLPAFVAERLAEEDRETTLDPEDLTAEAIFAAADAGDPVATEYLDLVARYNAAGLGAVANAYDPGLITLGGGVVLHNEERVLSGVRERLGTYAYVETPAVRVTPLGGEVGLYGALALPARREPLLG